MLGQATRTRPCFHVQSTQFSRHRSNADKWMRSNAPSRRATIRCVNSPRCQPWPAKSTPRGRNCDQPGGIVGYSIDSRMKSRIAVSALNNAVSTSAVMSPDVWFTPIEDRNSGPGSSSTPSSTTAWSDPWAGSARPVTTPRWNPSSPCSRRTSWTADPGPPGTTFASRSSSGSSAPTTAVDAKTLLTG